MQSVLEEHGDVAVLWIDNPPVNAISRAVKTRIVDGLSQVAALPQVRALVIACKGKTFSAGADIKELGGPAPDTPAPDVMAAIRDFGKPIVSAIQGRALGGGLELALAGDWRVATADAAFGLPEVRIGLLPGWGGTQRLPRLVGVDAALDLILTGRQLRSREALELGLIDHVAEGPLIDAAIAFAREALGRGARRTGTQPIGNAEAHAPAFTAARQKIAREMRLQHAPERIVECVEAAVRLPLDEGLAFEREQFLRCARHPQAKALQHRFFAERQAATVPGLSPEVRPRSIGKGAVIGAGTMGRGIAMSFANAGLPVVLMDASPAAVEQALGAIRKTYESSVKRGRLHPEELEARVAKIQPATSYEALRDADFIIEAVFEQMPIKKAVFAEIDKVAPAGAVLASNTSFLSIDEIASATSRPADVIGTHFFAPANVMRLLEIVRGDASSSDEALATALSLARTLGKIAVVAGNRYGFIGNRMINAYLHQADLLLLEGAQPEQIDRALVGFGMAMGPLQMRDLSGFTGVARSRRERGLEHFDPRSIPVLERLIDMGRHGQKTMAGYYDYEPPSREGKPSPVVGQLVADVARELGIEQRAIDDQEIVERCLLALANVGMDILAEGVASRASDIDMVYLNGYGFPAHQGGPMHWLEHEIGLAAGLQKLQRLSAHVGERWLQPSPLLAQIVARGEGLPQ